jgi:acetylornithine deacetylase/succinyl-diaminopimelate desuccinylase-like protein
MVAILLTQAPAAAAAQAAQPTQATQATLAARAADPGNALAREIMKELVEIDTTPSGGGTTRAAEAMAARLRAAGFPKDDIQVIGPENSKKNLVVRLKGAGKHKPVLMIGHLDVVEATRSEWATDPFKLVEQDGFFYGRGTIDMKNGDAIMVASLLRMKATHFKPSRDIILALTADEEVGGANGVQWLFKNHRELVDAEFALNQDDNSIIVRGGKPQYYQLEAAEKVYADFQLITRNPGGHSSTPPPDNAIYELANGLTRLAGHPFPVELNNITRAYYEKMASVESGERAADMRAILLDPPDTAAAARLSKNRIDNAVLHTTCVATRVRGGDQNNSLPQYAEAIVNCRILPGNSPEKVRQALLSILADPKIAVKFVGADGTVRDTAPDRPGLTPPPLNPVVMKPLQALVNKYWPSLVIVPTQAAGASDSIYVTQAGMPAYLITGVDADLEDDRFHARNERIGLGTFYTSNEFFYDFLQAVTAR